MDERQAPRSEAYAALPAEEITIDQVIAWNMRHWRTARYMTQEELGRQIGLSAANVSAIERSAGGGKDRRRLDAQAIAEIASTLDVPIAALFLPPEDDGQGRRYRWRMSGPGTPPRSMRDLMEITMHYHEGMGALTDEYADRFRGAVTAYLEEEWGAEVGNWFAPMNDKAARAEQAGRFRSRQAILLRLAAEDGELADFLDPGDET